MIEVKVSNLGVDSSTRSPVVILKESSGSRVVPIWIGINEANAIGIELAGIKPPRPLTHDLMRNLLKDLGAALNRVIINDLKDGTYYARIDLVFNKEIYSIDARPSDSIALALRMKVPIYVADEALTDKIPQIEIKETLDLDEPEQKEDLKDYLKKMRPEDFGKFEI